MSDKNQKDYINNNTGSINDNRANFGPKIDKSTGRIEFTDSYTEYMSTFRGESGEEPSIDDYLSKRESIRERRAKRRVRAKRRRRIIALCTVVLAVCVIALFAVTQFNTAYDDEDGFQSFADQHLRKMHKIPDTKDRIVTYEYGDTVSFAYRYDPSMNEELAVFRDQQVEDLKEDFQKSVKKQLKDQNKPKNRLFRMDPHFAMLFDSAVYDSGNGALTMAIYSVEYQEVDGKMKPVQTAVETYLLDPNSLQVLSPMQLLTPEYKEKASAFSKEYIQKTYKEDQILPAANKYLKESDRNYNQFVLEDGDMTVFFDEGTVVDPAEGVIAVTIPKVYLGTSLRSKVITRYIDPDKPMVAITYDDGPGGDSEKRILKCLKKYGAVATFFYVGNRVKYDSKNVKTAFDLGCEIANHSWDHADLTGLSAKGVKSELKKTNKAIQKVIGAKPSIFRPPYGAVNESVTDAAGMPAILWSIDTEDWSSRDANAVYKKIKKAKNLDGEIILMHSIYKSTAKATEKIVPYLQDKGYQLVTVSELIKYKTGHAPKKGKVYVDAD